MVKINEGDYAYASAYIRAVETKILGNSHFDRMLDVPGAEEAFKVLAEAEYGFGTGNYSGVGSYEVLLAEEMKKCYTMLAEISPDIEVVKAFQRRNDYFNVKVLLKAELSGQEVPDILIDTGTVDRDTIKRMIREREYGELGSIMSQAIEETHDAFSRVQDPQIIDLLLDRASYHQLAEDLKEIESLFLHRLAEIIADTTNIKMFIRARTLNKAWDFIKKLLLKEGTVSEKVYAEFSDKPIDTFIDNVRYSEYGDAVYKGWELFKTRKNISGLAKQLDDFLMEYIRKAKMVTMGVEPIVAYLFAKETEIRNVRIILTGRINHLPSEMIRERLRLGYV